jgi:hypothetical protein
LLALDGAQYAYSDDVYLLSCPIGIAKGPAIALAIYKKMRLWIGKTELILLFDYNPDTFLSHKEAFSGGMPHVVIGFTSCLGVPRHASNDPDIVTSSLVNIGVRHDRLLDLVEEVAGEDPFVGCNASGTSSVLYLHHLSTTLLLLGTRRLLPPS